MKTMTIRNIPDSVATGLAECARASGRSMNATAVAALAEAFDKDAGKKRRRDFSEFVGILAKDDAEAIKLIRNRFSGARTPARLPVRVRTQTG